ncbi:hypothetical protein BDR26DRAFT_490026 [Obelidium mucronatum]|nr:hypothetical protein BDR26DRAFT_490026 [Obelidium mucronatum]
MNSPQFALTDSSVTKIMQWKRYQPTFYNGSSIPPPDGPRYTHISIDPNSRSGMMLKVFSASGISLAILFSRVLLIYSAKKQLPAYIVKDFYWICTTFGFFALEIPTLPGSKRTRNHGSSSLCR